MKVRDKLWLFASREHDDDIWYGNSKDCKLGYRSRITPTEGAAMLGIDNVIMVTSDGVPLPFSKEAYGYMESFCRMKNVWWTAVGSSGCRVGNEEDFIVDLAGKYPNLTAAFLDDLFCPGRSVEEVEGIIRAVKEKISQSHRPLELWATCYVNVAEIFNDPKTYELLDGITIWRFDTDTIPEIETYLETYEKLVPNKRMMLGLYLYNYRQRKAVEDEYMKIQCEKGLQWLREGRIEGMIFLTNCNMGIGLSSEYWLREWIDKVGDMEL